MSNADFKLGEILIFQHAVAETFRNNSECELVGMWEMRQIGEVDHAQQRIITVFKECYQVQFQDGEIRNVQPFQLRRKKPPTRESDTKVSWEDCGWNPHKIKETN